MAINVVGCALPGAVMVLATDVWTRHRLLRSFVGTGVLGGFTTFSTCTVATQRPATRGHPVLALTYLLLTLAAALLGVWATATATRRLVIGRVQ